MRNMGDEILINKIEAINFGTSIQVDTDKGRMFIDTNSILKSLSEVMDKTMENYFSEVCEKED